MLAVIRDAKKCIKKCVCIRVCVGGKGREVKLAFSPPIETCFAGGFKYLHDGSVYWMLGGGISIGLFYNIGTLLNKTPLETQPGNIQL